MSTTPTTTKGHTMYTENVDQVIIQAELTAEESMALIRSIAATGTENTTLRIELRRYGTEDANVFVSTGHGLATELKLQGVGVRIPDEVTA